jgi:hypothetical protein
MLRKTLAVLCALAASVTVGASPAHADTTSWHGHQKCSNGLVDNQVQSTRSDYSVRASGYVATYSGAYIRRVVLAEFLLNRQQGVRTVNYTGTAHSTTVTGIQTTYLPWMADYNVNGARADLASWWRASPRRS